MGVFSSATTRDYWRKSTLWPEHPIHEYMSQTRFEQILRSFHVSDPSLGQGNDEDNAWTYKVDPLLEAVRQASMKYYTPGTNVSIDEAMIRFYGRSQDTFKMPNKPINEGYKAFCLVDHGYVFDFRMASRSKPTPGVEDIDNLSRTSSTIFSLAMSLPYKHRAFTIYMDNFSSNVPLFLKLRKFGIGACGTARQNCSGF